MIKKTILIADDDTGLLKALACRLESEGYEVFQAQDGYQALALARKEHPDLLILDINMPAGSGVTVLARVKAIDEIAETPVIIITGQNIQSLPRSIREQESTTLLRKPFDTGTLIATVHEYMNGKVESLIPTYEI
ncbi:MAG: response regulator [Phycisphaerales bacterium]